MKKIILLTILLIASTQFTIAQNTIAKLKYEEAEEAFANNQYEESLKKLIEVEELLKATNPKILYLRIMAQNKLIQNENYENSPETAYDLNKNCQFYLSNYDNVAGIEEKYRDVYKVSESVKLNPLKIMYEKSQQGDIPSILKLGEWYFEKKQIDKSILWFEKAALQGDVEGMTNLGFIYQRDKKDFKNSYKWHEMAASKGSVDDMNRLGQIFYHGFSITEPNREKAIEWFKKACALNSIEGYQQLGRVYYDDSDTTNGNLVIDCYQKAIALPLVNRRDTVCASIVYSGLVFMYYKGFKTDKDFKKVDEYVTKNLTLVLNSKFITSALLCYRGLIFKNGGFGIQQDYDKAFRSFTEAIQLGDEKSSIEIAEMYQLGLGVKKNKDKAIDMIASKLPGLNKNADKGSLSAMRLLQQIYEKGIGVKVDLVLAEQWKKKADDKYELTKPNFK